MTRLWHFHGGVKPKEHKTLSCEKPIAPANLPPFLILPLLQHIGEPSEPLVQVGDKVLKGQIIAHCRENDCSQLMGTPIHASSSGTIVAIEPRPIPHPSGLMAPCIVIETDGQEKWAQRTPLADYTTLAPAIVRQHIAKAGIVGLGGAGFPSHMKLKPEGIDTLVVNGAECGSYVTCDDRLMREHPHDIIAGSQIIMHTLGSAKRCIIAIEDNKPAAYQALLREAEAAPAQMEVVLVPTRYPMGEERQLIQVLTGKEIGRRQIPASIGIVVHNVETANAVSRAVQLGEALLSRVVTVTGEGVKKPQNLEVLLGTPMHVVIDQCERNFLNLKQGIEKLSMLIMGGPMMGLSLSNDEMPIIKTTNCLIVSGVDEIKTPPLAMPCIRCGACADVCPINLLPQQLYWHTKAKDFKKAQDYHLFDCIDCGSCAYVCPSHIPLVSYYRYAKAEIRACKREREKAELARKRHELRTFRLERDKKERAAHLEKQKGIAEKSKQAAIKAAIERVKAKKKFL
jgi:electron transport complex protein RnfC